MEQFIAELVAKYPLVSMLVMCIGIFRVVFKPLMAFIHVVVAATPSSADDMALARVEASKVYKAVLWVVDYLTSIKLPGQK